MSKEHEHCIGSQEDLGPSRHPTGICRAPWGRFTSPGNVCISLILIGLIGWNISVTIHLTLLSNKISIIQERTKRLENTCSSQLSQENTDGSIIQDTQHISRTHPDYHEPAHSLVTRSLDNINKVNGNLAKLDQITNKQTFPDSDNIRRQRRSADREGKQSTRKSKRSKKSKVTGVHFAANVDMERVNREIAEGRAPTIGNFTEYGLQPHDQIYKIWRPLPWVNERMFQYNASSGKVKVKSAGLYLVYGQIMFHGPSARKSYGIHVNDETVPFIESLSFDNIHSGQRSRPTRSLDILGPDPDAVEIGPDPAAGHRRRHRRASYASYSQCNTVAVTYLARNDEVFLKSLETTRTLIPRDYLTFWGMAKL